MCGFVGMVGGNVERIIGEGATIAHRGPDEEGYYEDDQAAFLFRRLRIIDLKKGHQPMPIGDRYIFLMNGEIYNYLSLKEELQEKGYTFHTDTDTEVAGVLFQEEGVHAFERFRGMFAILVWDKEESTLYGARDPFGIKPFYYSEKNGNMAVASEMKGIACEEKEMNIEALTHYFSFQYVPEPFTMFEDIKKLEPGQYFVKKSEEEEAVFHQYFKPEFKPTDRNEDRVHRLRRVLDESVRLHMQSDVPVGAFLSGGIDSSAIVSLASRYHSDLQTFSVGFEQDGYSEVDLAEETAETLGVSHHKYVVTPWEFVEKLPEIVKHLDDPLADASAIPLYFVAREARKKVTVVLSGEGADELFGGYNIYRESYDLRMFGYVPRTLKNILRKLAARVPEGVKGRSFILRGTTPLQERYIGNAKIFEEEEKEIFLRKGSSATYKDLLADYYEDVETLSPMRQMQYIDMCTWLRGDILLKADKMTMANSLELRVPFLDREVFEEARTLREEEMITRTATKDTLRKAMQGIVPDSVLHRKKLGFPVPLAHWLRHELYGWAKQMIAESGTEEWIDKQAVADMLERHRTGGKDYSRKLWTILMFMMWHRVFVEERSRQKRIVSA
ncbi:asparagine synthase (glutamine-hydrolyzing) [Salimicrobium halophilum]|uniref:asparagine synthase (glutamine-hydrolyzing) n=1 Tax=Salimicrobium halophilum TaxID=86666 RepID=A0A1G8UR65_9BACI|nr:asparagine synthase (glutamine-hydrolyzing) [Salimicrobium halophilum]SDJ56017.1 asparagine synthase (glutamine-hydrolysing) [Salimicrobium halophilum]